MFTVDGQQHRTSAGNCPHEQIASHYQRFLIGQQHLLRVLHGSKRRRQSGTAHYRGHDRIHLGVGSHVNQGVRPGQHLDGKALAAAGPGKTICRLLIHHHGKTRLKAAALLKHDVHTVIGGQRKDSVLLVPGYDIQGAGTDRTGRAKQGERLRTTRGGRG